MASSLCKRSHLPVTRKKCSVTFLQVNVSQASSVLILQSRIWLLSSWCQEYFCCLICVNSPFMSPATCCFSAAVWGLHCILWWGRRPKGKHKVSKYNVYLPPHKPWCQLWVCLDIPFLFFPPSHLPRPFPGTPPLLPRNPKPYPSDIPSRCWPSSIAPNSAQSPSAINMLYGTQHWHNGLRTQTYACLLRFVPLFSMGYILGQLCIGFQPKKACINLWIRQILYKYQQFNL